MTDTTTDLLLAIDTSGGTSVAVIDGARGVLSEANGLDTMKHAEVIGRLIEQALAEASVSPRQLTGVVAGMGPGPFTGLRVGIAAAHTFALGLGVPVFAVVSHDAVALAAQSAGGSGELLVVSDARRREVYWSLFDLGAADTLEGDSSGATASAAGATGSGTAKSMADTSADAVTTTARALPVRLDGPGLAKPDALPHPLARVHDAAHVSAGALGLVALELRRTGQPFASDQALYLRSPDVTLSTGAKRVTQR